MFEIDVGGMIGIWLVAVFLLGFFFEMKKDIGQRIHRNKIEYLNKLIELHKLTGGQNEGMSLGTGALTPAALLLHRGLAEDRAGADCGGRSGSSRDACKERILEAYRVRNGSVG